jgi:hypothetical protein
MIHSAAVIKSAWPSHGRANTFTKPFVLFWNFCARDACAEHSQWELSASPQGSLVRTTPRSCPMQFAQNISLDLRGRFAAFPACKQKIDGLGGLAKMIHAIRTGALDVFLHLCRFLLLQQAKQEQFINII